MLPTASKRVQAALDERGWETTVVELPESTRTAKLAAAAIGCSLGQIVKSLVFRAGDSPVLVLASGVNRVDESVIACLVGTPITKASADFVREHTGYAIGGVPPVGHPAQLHTFVDRDLLQYEKIWSAAGTPRTVFGCEAQLLASLGEVVCITG